VNKKVVDLNRIHSEFVV